VRTRHPKGAILTLEDDTEIELPYQWEICGHCRGEGKSSAYLGAFTAEQMREDPDFSDDYRRGFYDRDCDRCGGTGKLAVPDREAMAAEVRDAYDAQCKALRELREDERSERYGDWMDHIYHD